MTTFTHVPGRTIEVELDFKDRELLIQAVLGYVDNAARCQTCGRPDKEEKRDKAHELAILDRIMKLVDRVVIEQYHEGCSIDLAERTDQFLKDYEVVKASGKFCHAVGQNQPFCYKDAAGVLVKRPKLTEDEERGVEKCIETFGSLAVPFPMGVFAFAKRALTGMDRWVAWTAGPVSSLNAKFGVGGLDPSEEPIHVQPTK